MHRRQKDRAWPCVVDVNKRWFFVNNPIGAISVRRESPAHAGDGIPKRISCSIKTLFVSELLEMLRSMLLPRAKTPRVPAA